MERSRLEVCMQQLCTEMEFRTGSHPAFESRSPAADGRLIGIRGEGAEGDAVSSAQVEGRVDPLRTVSHQD